MVRISYNPSTFILQLCNYVSYTRITELTEFYFTFYKVLFYVVFLDKQHNSGVIIGKLFMITVRVSGQSQS